MIGLVYEVVAGRVEAEFAGADITAETTAQALGYDATYGFAYGASHAEDIYVLDGAVVPRPAFPVSQVGNTLTVPPSTEYSVLGPATAEGIAVDGVLEFEFAEPGTYTVTLRLFPYLDAEVALEG